MTKPAENGTVLSKGMRKHVRREKARKRRAAADAVTRRIRERIKTEKKGHAATEPTRRAVRSQSTVVVTERPAWTPPPRRPEPPRGSFFRRW